MTVPGKHRPADPRYAGFAYNDALHAARTARTSIVYPRAGTV